MKVYVDEMPKVCADCKFCYYENSNGYCVANFIEPTKANEIGWKKTNLERDFSCPLQSLADNDKEVRKQVCDEIRDKLCDLEFTENDKNYIDLDKGLFIVDQIEKGE